MPGRTREECKETSRIACPMPPPAAAAKVQAEKPPPPPAAAAKVQAEKPPPPPPPQPPQVAKPLPQRPPTPPAAVTAEKPSAVPSCISGLAARMAMASKNMAKRPRIDLFDEWRKTQRQ
eukprot:433187-Prymnesium_polylepis.1